MAGVGMVVSPGLVPAGQGEGDGLEAVLDPVGPGLKKWASVCRVTRDAAGHPAFEWAHLRDTGSATDFWPASTIKLYAVVAALEFLNERGFSLEAIVSFEHRESNGRWVLDCARTVREMISETFRRSSNEDYTLLLRLVGIDRLNTRFLIPARGFERSALMRGYTAGRPWQYDRSEPQRIRLRSGDSLRSETHEHHWSGRYYAEERGCSIIDAKTGNVTTPRDLVECLRRILYHEHLPLADRYHLNPEQLAFLRHGGDGLTGLETRDEESGAFGWTGAAAIVFPQARYYHKCGIISNFALDLAAVDDTAQGGPAFLMAPVIMAGLATAPVNGEKLVGQMALRIAEWVRARHVGGAAIAPAARK